MRAWFLPVFMLQSKKRFSSRNDHQTRDRFARGMSGFWVRHCGTKTVDGLLIIFHIFMKNANLLHDHKKLFRRCRVHCVTRLIRDMLYLSNPKPRHTTGGAGRSRAEQGKATHSGGAGAAERGGARRGEAGRAGTAANYCTQKTKGFSPATAPKRQVLDVSSKTRTNEVPCKPNRKVR